MMGGFGFVTFRAEYGTLRVMAVLVNHVGKLFQKDLGAKTAALAKNMKLYNPAKIWVEVQP